MAIDGTSRVIATPTPAQPRGMRRLRPAHALQFEPRMKKHDKKKLALRKEQIKHLQLVTGAKVKAPDDYTQNFECPTIVAC